MFYYWFDPSEKLTKNGRKAQSYMRLIIFRWPRVILLITVPRFYPKMFLSAMLSEYMMRVDVRMLRYVPSSACDGESFLYTQEIHRFPNKISLVVSFGKNTVLRIISTSLLRCCEQQIFLYSCIAWLYLVFPLTMKWTPCICHNMAKILW